MKLFSYLKYFGYIAFNWNARIASHILLQEIKGEKKYGINTTGYDELKKMEKKGIDISHATIYMPVNYPLLEAAFAALPPERRDHFLDLGSGKGRAVCMAAHHGFKQVTGIDISTEFCQEAKANLELTQQTLPSFAFKIYNNDAFYFDIPEDVDTVFLFNPFDEVILSGVAEQLQQSLEEFPRKLSIIYVNPLHKEFFTGIGFKQVFHLKKLHYLEVMILEN